MAEKLSRADLMAIISHLQDVIGKTIACCNDRNPNREAQVHGLLAHGHQLCIEVRSTEPPGFGSRSRFAKLDIDPKQFM